MTTEHLVRIVAGSFILMSLALGVSASPIYISSKFLFFLDFGYIASKFQWARHLQ